MWRRVPTVVWAGRGDVAESWWFWDAELVEQVALVIGELGALGELAVGRAEAPEFDAADLVADRAPGVTGADLGDAGAVFLAVKDWVRSVPLRSLKPRSASGRFL